MPLSVCPPNLIGIGLVHRIFNTFCEAPISAIFYRISENSSDSCYPTTFIQRFAMEKAPLWRERLWKKGSLVIRAMVARYLLSVRPVGPVYFLLQRPMTLPCGSPIVPQ